METDTGVCAKCSTCLQKDWKFCPFCGRRIKKGRRAAVITNPEPLTDEDWAKILNAKASFVVQEYFRQQKMTGNAPGKCPRLNAVNQVFIDSDLPYRVRDEERKHTWVPHTRRHKIFKVIPKNAVPTN